MLDAAGTGLLTLRVWCEDGSTHPLRAEVRIADDVAAGFRSALTLIDPEEVLVAVRAFLDDVMCPPLPSTVP